MMRDSLGQSIAVGLLVLVALSGVDRPSASVRSSAGVMQDASPRKPLGVFAKASIETVMEEKKFQGASDAVLRAAFRKLYAQLLANPAIAGLTIGAHWDHIQTAEVYPDGYDFSFLDDAFIEAKRANKSVALIITPGVVSPKWLLDKIPDCTINGVFLGKGVAPKCGKQAFEGFPEEQRDDGNNEIPLPWNDKYQEAWADFLVHLNDRYGGNPAFVAIAVAGPIAASDEIILPTSENVDPSKQQPSGLPVDETWRQLISHSFPDGRYATNPDQAFIDSWKTTINSYEQIF
jgi:hypothetical protein